MGDLRVLFDVAEDTDYRAWLADAGGHKVGVEVPFTPFLSEEDYEGLCWYLEDYVDLPNGSSVVRELLTVYPSIRGSRRMRS
jgi:hypothetical protein